MLGGKSLLGNVKKKTGKKAAAVGGAAPALVTGATTVPAAAPGQRTHTPASRVTGSDEPCRVALADVLCVLEQDRMFCKSELLYKWHSKAVART